MKIVYLPSASPGLVWHRRYYSHVFPEGARRARAQFVAMRKLLAENPFAGRSHDKSGLRLLPIGRTPFCVIYRVRDDRIEILAVHDERSDPQNAP